MDLNRIFKLSAQDVHQSFGYSTWT